MTTHNEAFEKSYGELPHDVDSMLNYQEARAHFYAGWQAAKADSESILAEQQNTIVELKSVIEVNHALMQADDKEIEALQAHINVLREAIQNLIKVKGRHNTEIAYKKLEQALTSTPAQSLQAHDDEVIERCAKIAEDGADSASAYQAVEKIKALKGE